MRRLLAHIASWPAALELHEAIDAEPTRYGAADRSRYASTGEWAVGAVRAYPFSPRIARAALQLSQHRLVEQAVLRHPELYNDLDVRFRLANSPHAGTLREFASCCSAPDLPYTFRRLAGMDPLAAGEVLRLREGALCPVLSRDDLLPLMASEDAQTRLDAVRLLARLAEAVPPRSGIRTHLHTLLSRKAGRPVAPSR
jgi:hypothetical protein